MVGMDVVRLFFGMPLLILLKHLAHADSSECELKFEFYQTAAAPG
jgi:hypothetical protein